VHKEKRKPALKRQAVKRKKKRSLSRLWRVTILLGTYTLKLSCLLGLLAVLSFLFLSVYQYLLTSPHIRLEQVVIEGVDKELKPELARMAQLSTETSLLAIRLNDVKKKMEKHPWIQTVHVERRFPHTLVIQAKKEEPRAIVVLNGQLHYMNLSGKVFVKADEKGAVDLPLITGISTTGRDQERQLKLAARILRGLEQEKGTCSLEELSEIHIEEKGRTSLYFCSLPASITLDGLEFDGKIHDLMELVQHLEKTGQIHMVKRINLDYTDGAAVSFRL
jgi:cell division septal protein FtsQ